MSITTDEYDCFVAQCAHQDPELLQEALDIQRTITEGLLMVAQYGTDDPERRAILDELEEQAREIGLLSNVEDECSCNCSCSSASTSSSLIELNTEDTDTEPEPELDPTTPGKILEAAAAKATNDTDGSRPAVLRRSDLRKQIDQYIILRMYRSRSPRNKRQISRSDHGETAVIER